MAYGLHTQYSGAQVDGSQISETSQPSRRQQYSLHANAATATAAAPAEASPHLVQHVHMLSLELHGP